MMAKYRGISRSDLSFYNHCMKNNTSSNVAWNLLFENSLAKVGSLYGDIVNGNIDVGSNCLTCVLVMDLYF